MITLQRTYRFRMCEADRATYGGPEWAEYRDEDVLDLPFDTVDEIESTAGMSMMRMRLAGSALTARGLLMMLWLARGRIDNWETFRPNVQRLEVVFAAREDDVHPPASTGASSETDESATS